MSASLPAAAAPRLLLVSLLLGVALAGCAPDRGDADQVGATAPQGSSEQPTTPVWTKPASTPKPTPKPTAKPTPTTAPETGTVSYVMDGDTLQVKGIGRIRLIGIDAPEYGECGFTKATKALSALVKGRTVTLTPGGRKDFDQYGRLLRYVDVGSEDAGLSLITRGWAIARYDSRDGYGRHPREDVYIRADAASKDLGCYPAKS